MSIKLKQPIINGSLRATNFFNGRLVTGADLTREQTSRREAVWRAGKAAGEGIVYGLEVEKDKDAGVNPMVTVSKGLAVNRCGQALYLSDDTSVDLLQRFGTVDQPSTIFGNCQPLQVGTYAAGFGFYLLVLSPVETNEGSAPTSGLNNVSATCNTNVILETAQFNLLPVDPFLKNETLPGDKLLRNYLAYRCFGASKSQDLFKNPLGFPLDSYGLIDEMRSSSLADSDVPLAIINWTSKGVEFVETWGVRRRVTRRDADKNWTQLVKDRRRSETEAMMMQFAEQIKNLEAAGTNLSTIAATQYFRYLPPAGLLPVANGAQTGFNPVTFFGSKGSTIATIDGELLPVLLEQALSHEPIDLNSNKTVQLYYVKENIGAAGTQGIRKSLVFARHSLPYMGQYVPTQQIFTFSPILLPLPDKNIFQWFINFNQATVLPSPNEPTKYIKGSMIVQLPDGAVIKAIIVRGLTGDLTPKIFTVTLESQKLDSKQPNTTIVSANLSKIKTDTFSQKVNAQKAVTVDNSAYQYVISAEWQNGELQDGIGAPGGNQQVTMVEINSIQVICEI
jgi:hypothetical protein